MYMYAVKATKNGNLIVVVVVVDVNKNSLRTYFPISLKLLKPCQMTPPSGLAENSDPGRQMAPSRLTL